MLFRTFLVSMVLTTLVACGKDKSDGGGGASGGGGGGGGGGGPSCAEAAAFYLDAHVKGGGNKISPGIKPPPTPDEIKTLTAAFEADCNSRPWTAQEKTCVMQIKNLLTDDKCFKGLQVAQMVHDAAQRIKDARAAAGSAAGSAAPAGSGSAAGSAAP